MKASTSRSLVGLATNRTVLIGAAIASIMLLILFMRSRPAVSTSIEDDRKLLNERMVDECGAEILRSAKFDPSKPALHFFTGETECEKEKHSAKSNRVVKMKANFGEAPICIHPVEEDIYVSGLLAQAGVWERQYMDTITNYLRTDKTMTFLDIGCNIGVFTIMAAKMGHKVVCVDANRKNLRLVYRSLELGGLQSQVTLIWNAIGDKRAEVSLQLVNANVGGAFVKEQVDGPDAHAVVLDDLIPLFGKEKIFIKIDIESYEWNALKGGEQFFNTLNVQFIFMEWVFHIENIERATNIVSFLSKFNFDVYKPNTNKERLDISKTKEWPWEILWIRR